MELCPTVLCRKYYDKYHRTYVARFLFIKVRLISTHLKDGWTKFTQKGGTRENGNHSTGITNTTSLKTTFSMKPRHNNT